MVCNILHELEPIIRVFDEYIIREKVMWGKKELFDLKYPSLLLNVVIDVLRRHSEGEGYYEVYYIEGGEGVSLKGGKLFNILKGYVISYLCYPHKAHLMLRIVVKEVNEKKILTVYGDLIEDSEWFSTIYLT